MENVSLIGLSRQMTLERQLDVVANNVANINTNGYKADRSMFQEFLASGAHEDNFVGRDRNVSFVQDRATLRDLTAGPTEQTKNPLDLAIDGNAFLAVQTPAGERYTRDGGLQINTQGQLVTASGYPVLGTSGPIVFQPGDKDINIAKDGNVSVIEGANKTDSIRGKLRLVSFAQAQRLLKEGANLYSARNEPDDRGHPGLHPDLGDAAAADRHAQISDRKARRRSGLRKQTHARSLHCSKRNGGPGTQRPGHLQQHRQHAHHRLQEAAGGVPGSDL
jgi:flagellar basal-body rod protein FlgF